MRKQLLFAFILAPLFLQGTEQKHGIDNLEASIEAPAREFATEERFQNMRGIAFEPERVFSEETYESEELKQIAFEERNKIDDHMMRIVDALIAENSQPVKTEGEDIDSKAFNDTSSDDNAQEEAPKSDIKFVSEREHTTNEDVTPIPASSQNE